MPPDAPERPLKILRVIARLNVGGPARHVVLLNAGLDRLGHRTLLVHGALGAGEASFEHLAQGAGIAVRRIPGLGPRLSVFSDIRAFLELLRLTFREQPDIVHTHTAKAGALGRVCAALYNLTRGRGSRALIVHTFHGHVLTGYFSAWKSVAVRSVERLLGRLTDRIIAISPTQKQDLAERFGIVSGLKIAVVPLGLDLDALLAVGSERGTVGSGGGGLTIGYVGRFVAIKDLGTLVDAFAIVAGKRPDATLMLAGNGPTYPAVEAAVSRGGLNHRVRWVGWTEDLVSLYSAMDICALTSLNEGTPVALIEAMAAGKPVVATRVGGVGDLVEDGRTGLLVPPGRPDSIADALLQLIDDPGLRASMGRAGRAVVASRFSHHRLVTDVAALYAADLEGKRRPKHQAF